MHCLGMTHADSLSLPPSVLTKQQFYSHVAVTLRHLLAPSTPDRVRGNWPTCLSNAASLLSGSYENFDLVWGKEAGRRVNWAGFYLHPALFPHSDIPYDASQGPEFLLLGPFQGRPACLEIPLVMAGASSSSSSSSPLASASASSSSLTSSNTPAITLSSTKLSAARKSRPLGVCAEAYLSQKAIIVPDVNQRVGHIACDGVTRSEIVIPIFATLSSQGEVELEGEGEGEGDKTGSSGGKVVVVAVLDIDCEALAAFDEQDQIGLEKIVKELNRVIDWKL